MGKAKMGIVINHSENIFLRQTRSNSYAFGIDDQGLVRHTEFLPWYEKYEEAMEAPVKNEVAIVYDYDSLASFRIQRQSILLDPAEP